MTKCAIFRAAKRDTRSTRSLAHHALREGVVVPNAILDGDGNHFAPQILEGHAGVAELFNHLKQLKETAQAAGQRWRPNITAGVDMLFTYTRGGIDSLEDQDRYFRRCLDWVHQTWPTAVVLTAAVHRDESTPHMQLLMAPTTSEGIFSAKKLLGGPSQFHSHQNSFWEHCGEPFGLDRGTPGSKAKHIPVDVLYEAMAATDEIPQFTAVPPPPKKPGAIDRLKPGYAEKMAEYERLKKQRSAIMAANNKARKELEKQAEAGRKLSPKLTERMADQYRQAMALNDTLKGQVSELKTGLAVTENRLEEVTEAAKTAARRVDAFSALMSPVYVNAIAKHLGVPLRPGKGLCDQLRRADLAKGLISAADLLERTATHLDLWPREGIQAPAPAPADDGGHQHVERPRG